LTTTFGASTFTRSWFATASRWLHRRTLNPSVDATSRSENWFTTTTTTESRPIRIRWRFLWNRSEAKFNQETFRRHRESLTWLRSQLLKTFWIQKLEIFSEAIFFTCLQNMIYFWQSTFEILNWFTLHCLFLLITDKSLTNKPVFWTKFFLTFLLKLEYKIPCIIIKKFYWLALLPTAEIKLVIYEVLPICKI
jgi:hypothetical protein